MVSSSLSLESSLLQCLHGHAHQGIQVTDQNKDTQDSIVPQKQTTNALVYLRTSFCGVNSPSMAIEKVLV